MAIRELTSHKVNEANKQLKIEVLDEPGSGGASHLYKISGFNAATDASDLWGYPADGMAILFQNGPIAETGVNGVTHEALLAVLIDRLSGFQDGPYACEENRQALFCIQSAKEWLHRRTKNRLERGVEGTHQV